MRRGLERLADLRDRPAPRTCWQLRLAGGELDRRGFGLDVGALFAKAIARKVRVDYRLLSLRLFRLHRTSWRARRPVPLASTSARTASRLP
ncbi:hypothetical protein DPM13_08850 [Paracoccus mutanolyticus]|uniref:Uncharacterized protein n=1 Tax=Paracoccus mutanolyticus TaxID=1499308 RepID=A0ABN5M5J5_9RHOB|nr:hypothetical protein DPM13_08850 [Paracoccus mutanolyticus]